MEVQTLLHKSCPSGSQFSVYRTMKKKKRTVSVRIVKFPWIKNKDAPLQKLKKQKWKPETKWQSHEFHPLNRLKSYASLLVSEESLAFHCVWTIYNIKLAYANYNRINYHFITVTYPPITSQSNSIGSDNFIWIFI